MNTDFAYGECPMCRQPLLHGHKCDPIFIAKTIESVVTNTKLAEMIRLYIAVKNISNKQLSVEWRCSESTVSRFLSGAGFPDGETTARIISWILL